MIPGETSQPMIGCTLLALAGAISTRSGLQDLASVAMAGGALAGGLGSLLPSLSRFLDAAQARRHAAERHRAALVARVDAR